MRSRRVSILALICSLLLLSLPRRAAAYSVLSHEAVVDALWEDSVLPLLKARFPRSTADELRKAHAFAYGGTLIQDLGYYPFGSKLFSNLAHYIRSGDFVEALIDEATTLDELGAFALGALAHYSSDNTGHPIAVNHAVPMMYPKLAAKYGDEMLYVDSPARHVMVEFAFDVTQVAQGGYAMQAYRDMIGFEVAEDLLARAFKKTYGLELDDLFLNRGLAIGTYRHAVSTTIPEMTRLAWRDKQKEILARTPTVTQQTFVFAMPRAEYEKAYGTTYQKPGLFSRFLVTVFKVLPKVGPMRPLAFEPLSPAAEQLFLQSFAAARDRFRTSLQALRAHPNALQLADTDLDTGKLPARGVNALAEETYVELLDKLEDHDFADVPPELRRDITRHFAQHGAQHDAGGAAADHEAQKRERKARKLLVEMNAMR